MNWDIKGCGGRCAKCDKEFIDEETFHCRLFLEQSGPRREDYCVNCWSNLGNDTQKGFSVWQGRYKLEPVEISEIPVEDSILKHLLKKWLHSQERLHQCFCYVLAILLERNKTFMERPKVKNPDGREELVYEDKDSGETYILEDPKLTLKELGEIESQLQEMLKQELKSDSGTKPLV